MRRPNEQMKIDDGFRVRNSYQEPWGFRWQRQCPVDSMERKSRITSPVLKREGEHGWCPYIRSFMFVVFPIAARLVMLMHGPMGGFSFRHSRCIYY